MLKKKYEEAKEMLVRAVVNNNNLLMLNHPIYEAKISFILFVAVTMLSFFCVPFWYKNKNAHSFTTANIHKIQKFAAKLASKELQVC